MLKVFSKLYANRKNVRCFFILKNVSNMTCLTAWYSDIVYSEITCVWKTLFPALTTNSTRREI